MGRYGTHSKKDIEYIIKTGCNYVDSMIKDKDDSNSIIKEIELLKKTLYNEGDILSDTNKVRFEKRLINLENKISKANK